MKLRLLVFLFCGFCNRPAFAQQKFLPGTLLLNNGDTLTGYLSEIYGRISPSQVVFKTRLSDAGMTYSPSELRWFRFQPGDWYFSYMGPLETSSLHPNSLSYDSAMTTKNDTLFIRAVLLGRASLFYARDRNDRIHLFMKKPNTRVVELGYKKFYIDEVVVANYQNKITRRAIMDNQLYKAQLMQAFSDCQYLAASITQQPLTYSKTDLEKLFERYNQCRGSKIEYREPPDNGRAVFTINGGINYSRLEYSSESYPRWNDYQLNASLGGAFGIGGDFLLPRTQGQWGFFNELSLKSFSATGNYEDQQDVLKLDMIYLQLATMMRYYLKTDRHEVRPFFAAGICNNVLISSQTIDNSEHPEDLSVFDDLRSYEQGLIFSFGIYYKRLNGELRYEFSNGTSAYTSLSSPARTAYLLIGYKLFEL
jgi:hypothetical protein